MDKPLCHWTLSNFAHGNRLDEYYLPPTLQSFVAIDLQLFTCTDYTNN